MGAMKDHAKKILAADISTRRGIPLAAADDLIEHIQSEIYAYENGETPYETVAELFADYGIPVYLQWVFEV